MKFIIPLIIIAIGLFSCEKDDEILDSTKNDFLDQPNSSIEIEYFSKSTGKWELLKSDGILYDTARVYTETAKIYTEEKDLSYSSQIRIKSKNNNYYRVYVEPVYSEDYSTRVLNFLKNELALDEKTKNIHDFSVFSIKQGVKNFKVRAADDFGNFNESKFNLVFLPNKNPVAKLKLQKHDFDSRIYWMDFSDSFDQDEKLGGRVVEYHYWIEHNGIVEKNQTEFKSIRYVFDPGKNIVSVRVRDNDGQLSKEVKVEVNIPPFPSRNEEIKNFLPFKQENIKNIIL